MREHRDLGLDAGVVAAADDLDDAADGVLVLLRILERPRRARCRRASRRAFSPRAISTSVRSSPSSSTQSMPRSRRSGRRSSLLPRARISTRWPSRPRGDSLVRTAMRSPSQRLRISRAERYMSSRAVVGRQEAEAVAMRLHDARDEVEMAYEAILALAVSRAAGRREPSRACAPRARGDAAPCAISKRGAMRLERQRPAGAAPLPRRSRRGSGSDARSGVLAGRSRGRRFGAGHAPRPRWAGSFAWGVTASDLIRSRAAPGPRIPYGDVRFDTSRGGQYIRRAFSPRCPGGGIGRRAGFRCQWRDTVEVQVLSWAPLFLATRIHSRRGCSP